MKGFFQGCGGVVVLLSATLAASEPGPRYSRPAGAASLSEPFIAAGFRALFTCSAHFHAGRPLDDIIRVELADTAELSLPAPVIDRERGLVQAADLAGNLRTAVYRRSMGCTLLGPHQTIADSPRLAYVEFPLPRDLDRVAFPEGNLVVVNGGGTWSHGRQLGGISDRVFDADSYGTGSLTTGLVVVANGRILLEHYRPLFGPHSGYRTWSTAKTISAAVIGVAVAEGLLDIHQPAPIPEWQFGDDPRADITPQQLLWMASGLVSEGAGTDAIYFGGQDVVSAATTTALEAAPGTRWKYANNDTLLLMRALRAAINDDHAYLRYPYEKLLRRIGMYDTRMETDHAGNFIGSSQVYTTARDLARFGLLLVNDGVWQGERLLPEGWVEFLTTPAPMRPTEAGQWGYGAQVWLLDSLPGIPAGTFTTAGNKGQFVTVVPKHDLVIVRTGVDPAGVRFAQGRLAADIVAELYPDGS